MYVWQKIFIFSIFIPTTDVQIVYNRWKDFKQFDREEYINVPPSSRFLIIVDRIFEARSRNYNSSSCRACYKSLNNICHAIVATWPTNVENRVFPRRGEGIENLKTNDPLAGGGVKPRGRSTGKYPCRIVFFFSFLFFLFELDDEDRGVPHRKRHSGLELDQDLDVIFEMGGELRPLSLYR